MSDTIKMPFAIWKIGEEEFKLKLTTSEIVRLEGKYKANLMSLMMANDASGIPTLNVMIDITHGALQKFHHGLTVKDVMDMFDDYCEEGGNQTVFVTDVLLTVYQVSGFFSPAEEAKKVAPRKKKVNLTQ